MRKILIPLCVILALYIGYEQFTNENKSKNINESSLSKSEEAKDSIKIHHYEPEVELPNIDTNPLLGDYSAKVNNDKLSASLTLSLLPDQKIKHFRSIDRAGVISEGEITGEYVVEGNLLTFTFPETRDKEVFPMGKLILTVAKDNSISSGEVQFTKI